MDESVLSGLAEWLYYDKYKSKRGCVMLNNWIPGGKNNTYTENDFYDYIDGLDDNWKD